MPGQAGAREGMYSNCKYPLPPRPGAPLDATPPRRLRLPEPRHLLRKKQEAWLPASLLFISCIYVYLFIYVVRSRCAAISSIHYLFIYLYGEAVGGVGGGKGFF